jgi:hypothetical protein
LSYSLVGVRSTRLAAVLPTFAASMFLSAGLMFLVEPMVAKMVLPRLGGSPAVWTTCLLFFQGALLLGYAYAHGPTRLLPPLGQILVHLVIVLPLAVLVLPLDLGADAPPPSAWPPAWLLMRLTLSAGAPVVAIAATAPLLQSWFARLDHEAAGDPYFLYAGSNAGSLLALLAYPLAVEPALPLSEQAAIWSWGYGGLIVGIALCAAATLLGQRADRVDPSQADLSSVNSRERLIWIALAFVPSSLLLGVTAHITTDLASAPLLWVLPLALYLLTFILAFARRPVLPLSIMVRVLTILLILLVVIGGPSIWATYVPLPILLMLDLGCFFAAGMVCHGELARRRPPASQLTEFYFFVAVGGVLGGLFNAILAPLIFPGVWEYPLALVALCLLRPIADAPSRAGLRADILLPLGLLGFLLLATRVAPLLERPWLTVALCFLVPALVLVNFSPRRLRFALGIAACVFVFAFDGVGESVASYRSFFGVYRVRTTDDGRSRLRYLVNGTTLHGVESLTPGEETTPMSYYSREGPFGRFFEAVNPALVHNVAVIGLGAGSLACYAQPNQDWTFYEIDPLVERLARDPRYFHFLAECGNHPRVVLGDARQTIQGAQDGTYDLIIVDAFSSDSIPMHLLTREALSLYLRKLAPDGRLLFHISNRRLDLRSVVGALAADAGAPARALLDVPPPGASGLRRMPALVVALAGRGGNLDGLDPAQGWVELPPAGARWLWTDQRSDILTAIQLW